MSDEPKETKEQRRQRKEAKAAAKEAKAVAKEEEKRKELEEIEISLQGDIPLNRKQQRLLKKGKLNLDRLKARNPNPRPENEEKPAEKGQHGVWIGNLAFDTTKDDIIRFIKAKTDITDEDITRFNLPKKLDKIKGFCYVDFKTDGHMTQVVALSESVLNGRKLLIKNANSFEGRPEKKESGLVNVSKNPPSRILFVGNLSFDTTEELLSEHFSPCGEIVKIRMATFEDSGKCKGFAFVDFKDDKGPTTALTTNIFKTMINRPLRMEYGEDRSKRNPKRKQNEEEGRSVARERGVHPERAGQMESGPSQESFGHHGPSDRSFSRESSGQSFRQERPEKRQKREVHDKRNKSSVALANAQRASAAIVPSSGKKVTFD